LIFDHSTPTQSSAGTYRLEQADLMEKSGVAITMVRRMESFEGEIGSRTFTLSLVQKTLEEAGVELLNDERSGVRMRAKS
jgi:hypothetical protein